MTTEKVSKSGIKKEKGFLYYLGDDGNLYRVKMEKDGRRQTDPQLMAQLGVQKAEGFLYFIDEDGDVSRSPLTSPPLK
jgi:hypothetical protein